jgi:hypothetical protein
MKKTAIHCKIIVHDASPRADYATVALRFGATADSYSCWHVRAQRNNLDRIGRTAFDHLDRKTLVRWEAERIEHDPNAELWDTVPSFGSPYAPEIEARSDAIGTDAFFAFARCMHGHRVETPSQLLALLACDRRIALTVGWEWCVGSECYTSIYDVPSERRWSMSRFLNSAEVLEAKAALLIEQAERARACAERKAKEAEAAESEAAE